MRLKDSHVLVTGGAGFIGSNLVRRLLTLVDGPESITIWDTASKSFTPNLPTDSRVQVIKGSILDEQVIRLAFRKQPDFVFHLAAHFANQKSLDYPETNLLVNGLGTLRVLEYSRLRDVSMTVFASSGCAMSGNRAESMTEDDITLHLDSPYQITKMLGELYFNFYHSHYGLPVSICRYFNVYGPGELPGKYRNVIPNFVWSALQEEPLRITGTGKETRDYTYVDDIVTGTLLAATSKQAVGEAFNLASGEETSVHQLVEAIAAGLGWKPAVEYAGRRLWDRTVRRRASIEKARRVLGYEPKTKIVDGIRQTCTWFIQHEQEIEAVLCSRE